MIHTARAWARLAPRRIPQNPAAHSSTARILRRPHITKAAPGVPDQSKTIPTPTTWLWLEPVARPLRAYGRVQQRRPYTTQFVSALVIYLVGDLVAQGIGGEEEVEEKSAGKDEEGEGEVGWAQAWVERRDWGRTARALFIGGLAAVPGYRWFLWLGSNFNYSSKVLSLTTKVLINQTFFTPVFNTYFFGTQSLLSGASLPETWTRVQNTVPVSVKNSWKFWPAVTAFMFAFVPIQYRNIFGGTIAIGWQTYLSLLNQRAAKGEDVEGAVEGRMVIEIDVQTMQRQEGRCAA